jgi:hypothetical protein
MAVASKLRAPPGPSGTASFTARAGAIGTPKDHVMFDLARSQPIAEASFF